MNQRYFLLFTWAVVCCLPSMVSLAQKNAAKSKPRAHARLLLSSSQNKVRVGECFILTYSFIVYQDNTVPIEFYNLQDQFLLQKSHFYPENAWLHDSVVEDIKGIEKTDNLNRKFTNYTIMEVAICPFKPGDISFPALTLEMIERSKDSTKHVTQYRTDPFTISVGGREPIADEEGNEIVASGTYSFSDKVDQKQAFVGRPFTYSLLVEGHGNSYPFIPIVKGHTTADIHLLTSESSDYVWNDTLFAKKRIAFSITPKVSGKLPVNEIFKSIRYFDPKDSSIHQFTSDLIINVSKSAKPYTPTPPPNLPILAMDVSVSMRMADYSPSRLGFLKKQLKSMQYEKFINPEILLFAGDVSRYKINSTQPIDSIDHDLVKKRGTSLSDVIWHSLPMLKKNSPNQKKLILISDGDETSRHLSLKTAATFAKQSGVKVYTIGIGTTGMVTLLGDAKLSYYSNTFSDKDLQSISAMTGGMYFYLDNGLKDQANLEDVLRIILND